MSAQVLDFSGITKLDLPTERILQRALDKGLTQVVVVGYDAEGEFFFASSTADGGDVLWLMEVAKKRLLEVGGA